MRLFIAEKPDLAKAILSGMDGNAKSSDGYIQKGDSIVTWAFGHILELCEPHEYNKAYEKWNLTDLPFKIDSFKYKPKSSAAKQLKIVVGLINGSNVDAIVNCGDADEEGQILIDEIVNYSKTKKPIYRMILKDITENGIRKSLQDIRPNSEFKGISDSGFARSLADWIVGINLTRAYTIKASQSGNRGVLSVGRVQTPILGLVVNRDKEHESHKESFYYSVVANTQCNGLSLAMKYKLSGDEKISEESVANEIKAKVQGKSGVVSKATHENKKESSPLPYSLLLLQAECSKKFGYKPDKVLEITQSLREKHKAISYNRSDCQYLNENTFEECPSILKAVAKNLPNLASNVSNCDTSIKHSAFNDKFVTAHTGIIPLANASVSNLSKDELNIYTLICLRFIALFYPAMEYIQSNIETTINGEKFGLSAKKITKQGYKEVYSEEDSKDEKESEECLADISTIKENDEAMANEVKITKEKTKPKPYYTMATLLKDLASVAKYVKDERIRELLKEKDKDKKGESGGIGTPATRSAHLTNLLNRGFIAESGKSIISTELGRKLYDIAPQILTSVDMTALWYEEQKEIAKGLKTKEEFLEGVKSVVAKEIEKLKGAKIVVGSGESYECPKCGSALRRMESKNKKGAFYWGCSNWQNCDIGFLQDSNGKPNLQSKGGEIDKRFKCPKCENGYLQPKEGVSKKSGKPYVWYGCSEWKSGCEFRCFDKNGEPNIEG